MSLQEEDSNGYVWRKYGEKTVGHRKQAVKRSYYRCVCFRTKTPCTAKKRVDRLASANPGEPPLSVSYVSRHNHNPPIDGSGDPAGLYQDAAGVPDIRRGLEQLRPEELAREMYNDLMMQLVESSQGPKGQLESVELLHDGTEERGPLMMEGMSEGFSDEEKDSVLCAGEGLSEQPLKHTQSMESLWGSDGSPSALTRCQYSKASHRDMETAAKVVAPMHGYPNQVAGFQPNQSLQKFSFSASTHAVDQKIESFPWDEHQATGGQNSHVTLARAQTSPAIMEDDFLPFIELIRQEMSSRTPQGGGPQTWECLSPP